MQNQVVSIIIPIYQVEKYIYRCIDSVIKQTYKNLEIILVDDGSPDKCGLICDEYKKKDKRIKVIHKKNGGLSEARNEGLKIVSGEYVGFIDSDDWVEENYIDELYKLLKTYNSDISVCNFYKISDNVNFMNNKGNFKIEEFTNIQALEEYFGNNYVKIVVTWGKLYRKNLFESIEFPVGKIHEDEFITHKLLYRANKIVMTTKCLYFYWQRPDSIMGRGFNFTGRLNYIEALNDRIKFYKLEHLENLYMNTIKAYYGIILDTYWQVIKRKKNYINFKNYFNDIKKLKNDILHSKFTTVFKMRYILFIHFPTIATVLEKTYIRVKVLSK